MEILVAKGANVNTSNNDGYTPLHWLAGIGRLATGCREVVDFLVSNGADVNATDKDNKTPLRVAEECQNNEVAEALRANGAQ
jgi:ankyrin repeat protein